jgi:uncharacterized membrane protein YhiD involved in acid resistance
MNTDLASGLDQLNKFSDIGVAVSQTQVVLALFSAFFLSLVVAKVYQISFRGSSYSAAFMQTLVICSMVIAAVMLIIGSNIARAFSLVGALSIIRFRNAVKDPRDVAFIFLSMGIGMACGTGFYPVAVILTVVTTGAILALTYFRFGQASTVERLIKLQIPATKDYERRFDEVFKLYTKSFQLLSVESNRMGSELELTYSAQVANDFSAEALIEAVTRLNSQLRVQVLGTAHALDL